MGYGLLKHVPDMPTYGNLFGNSVPQAADFFGSLPTSIPFSSGANLSRGETSGGIFLISNGEKRHITSMTTMDKYSFFGAVNNVPDVDLQPIPQGRDIS
jgi:hypothetical protein